MRGHLLWELPASRPCFASKATPCAALFLGRAAVVDSGNPGPSAAVSFAGVTCYFYRHRNLQTLQVHVERGLASYVWSWCETQPIFRDGKPLAISSE
jgi:hypothetical protein